jgi:S-adenosylmethionine/arginine decarboxylase-like enzyme
LPGTEMTPTQPDSERLSDFKSAGVRRNLNSTVRPGNGNRHRHGAAVTVTVAPSHWQAHWYPEVQADWHGPTVNSVRLVVWRPATQSLRAA